MNRLYLLPSRMESRIESFFGMLAMAIRMFF